MSSNALQETNQAILFKQAFKRVSGYQYLALSDPSPKKQYARVGWIQFGQNTNMDSALAALDKVKVCSPARTPLHGLPGCLL